MQEKMICLKNVVKQYKLYNNPVDRLKETFSFSNTSYSKNRRVLDNICLNIDKGDVLGIVGTNGAGKSTLLKIITGVLSPTSGDVEINGRIAALLELGTGFNPEFTGIKNIFLNGTMMGFSHEEMEDKLQDIIEFADIGEFINQPVKLYSSGMFARLAFAVAINVDPDILIVDEALSVGDIRFQMKCINKIKQMMDDGITVLFVSHDINAIRRLCTKTLWLKDGKVKGIGETNKICDQYLDYLKVGDNEIENICVEKEENEVRPFVSYDSDVMAEIVTVNFWDGKNNKVDEIDLFEPLRIEIVYDVYDESMVTPVLGVALKRIDDEYICGLNTMLDDIIIPWKQGRNSYMLEYDEGIRVLGGRYYFDVALFDKTATVPIQYRAKIKEITVTAPYIGEGICVLPHQWRKK